MGFILGKMPLVAFRPLDRGIKMELILILMAGVLGGVIWGRVRAVRRAKAEPALATPSNNLVGGWLAFLILSLMILGPLFNAGRIGVDLYVAEHLQESLRQTEAWRSFKMAAWLNYFAVTAISIYAGYGLLLKRSLNVVTRAKVAIWVTGPLGSVIYGYFLPKNYLGKLLPGFEQSLLVSVLAAVIWTVYLSRSERVKATYGNQTPGGMPSVGGV